MAKYDPKSRIAEEFISDEEIRETLRYAEENKNNLPLIREILDKARPKKTAAVSSRDRNGYFFIKSILSFLGRLCVGE